jgi:hypothetical protein
MKVFISGSRSIKLLCEEVRQALLAEIKADTTIIVGDADGVDTLVQEFFHEHNYKNLVVYASNGEARNNVGGWSVVNVAVGSSVYPKAFFAQKDVAMASDADCGIVIWDGASKGSLANIQRLRKQNKPVQIYYAEQYR